MKITNRHNLPEAIYRAAKRDDYTRGDSRVSVTQLIGSPRISALRAKHHADMTTDVVDRIWSMLGSAVHHLLERGADEGQVAEERLFADVAGWRVSGGIDVQDLPHVIRDYKVTSVWSVMYDKPEWSQQLNLYAYLVRVNKGVQVQRLEICAILRDWRRADADRDSSYPQQPIMIVPVEVWTPEEQDRYIDERVRLHQSAQADQELGEELDLCTDEERWMRGAKWAVMKRGAKRALRVFDTHAEAHAYAQTVLGVISIEHRPAEPKRCTGNYCGVADYCSQFKADATINKLIDSDA